MTGERLKKTAAVLLIAAAGSYLIKGTGEHLSGIVLPFLAAWIASAPARPLALWLARRTGMSRKICGGAVTFLVFFFFGYLLTRLSGYAAEEISSFISGLGNIEESIRRFLRDLKEKLPFSADFFDSPVYDTAIAALQDAALSFGGRLTSFLTALCGAIPGSVLSFVVFVAAFYYLTSDREGVAESILSLLPKRAAHRLHNGFFRLSGALFGYLRAYLLLMTVTFFELLVGLSLLRAPYVFVLSLIIAVVDALPVLGAGSVLVPWAVVSLVRGNTAFGTGLLILLGVMSLLRQLLEPKFIGRFIGVHPMIALAAVFVGYRLWGVFGMIASPVILYILKSNAASEGGKTEEKSLHE